jgi:hypothetical protein
MGRLNREKCKELVSEFADYINSEKNAELAPDGEKLVRQFCEAVCDDEAVREKFEDLLKPEEEIGDANSRSDSRNAKKNNGDAAHVYGGEERRKSVGGFHLYERRKQPHQYGGGANRSKQVQFGRGK